MLRHHFRCGLVVASSYVFDIIVSIVNPRGGRCNQVMVQISIDIFSPLTHRFGIIRCCIITVMFIVALGTMMMIFDLMLFHKFRVVILGRIVGRWERTQHVHDIVHPVGGTVYRSARW